MAVFSVFSQCVRYNYKSTVCSKATLFILIVSLLTFLPPILIAYRSHGFWLKSDTYQEQPDVHFKHEYLLIVETDSLEAPIICTTNAYLNQLTKKYDHCSMIKSREEDHNKDGRFDELNIEIKLLLFNNQVVHGVKLFLLFDYKLYKLSYFEMEALGFIHYSSSIPGARFDVLADLRLNQKQLFLSHGRDLRFNRTVINVQNVSPETFNLQALIRDYGRRNISAILRNVYPLWTAGRPSDEPFIVSATIFYPEETILYKPGFWQVIKWAWMQYLAILVIFTWVFRTVKSYVFKRQLVNTIVDIPWRKIY